LGWTPYDYFIKNWLARMGDGICSSLGLASGRSNIAPGISTDPLNAIKNSAITLQETVQYLNITKTDYISSSVSLRNFLKKHGFCIYEYDEMGEESATTLLLERTRLFTNACILAWSFKAYKLNHGEDL